MSLPNRPRVVIDGVRRTRTYQFYRCSQCDRTVRVASGSNTNQQHNSLCPFCYHFLCQELHISRPSTPLPSAAQLLDTMAHFINLSPQRPTIQTRTPQQTAPSQEPSDHITEDQTAENAMNSIIDIVRVTPDILDSTCPICKEEFELNEEIRKLGCNHYYHTQCIIPWLQINSTCPVCRYQLPLLHQQPSNDVTSDHFRGPNYYNNSNDDYDFRLDDVWNLGWPSWAELLTLIWPFRLRSLLDWTFPD